MAGAKKKHARPGSNRLIFYSGLVIALLLAAHVAAVYAALYAPDSVLKSLVNKFDLDQEYNLPTYVNSLFFLIGAYWCARLAAQARWIGHRLGWVLFSLLFIYMALDEALIIHEQIAEPLRKLLDIRAGSPFFHAWVIPGMILLGLAGAGILILQRHHRRLTLFSGTAMHISLLAGGVIAIEVIGTYFYANVALYRFVMVPFEEAFELSMSALLWVRLRQRYYTKR